MTARTFLTIVCVWAAALVYGCAVQTKDATSCMTVVSPFTEDPIIIPASLSDNIELCAPKNDLYRVTRECVSLAAVRRYIFINAAQNAELER